MGHDDEQKMSKSLGNVIDPFEMAKKYGSDAVRYYLLKDTVYGQDSSIGEQFLVERYNADLANDLGNLLSRVRALLTRHTESVLPAPSQQEVDQAIITAGTALVEQVRTLVGRLRIFEALETVMQFVAAAQSLLQRRGSVATGQSRRWARALGHGALQYRGGACALSRCCWSRPCRARRGRCAPIWGWETMRSPT